LHVSLIHYEHNLQVLHIGQHYRVWLSNYVNNDKVSLRLFWVYCIHGNACKSCRYSFIKYVCGILYICNYFSVVYYWNVLAISFRISRLLWLCSHIMRQVNVDIINWGKLWISYWILISSTINKSGHESWIDQEYYQ